MDTSKQLISEYDLIRKLNEALAWHPECKGFEVTALEHFAQDRDGSNWALKTVEGIEGEGTPEACRAALEEVTGKMQARYDLLDEPR